MIRVLVVDDSAIVRKILVKELSCVEGLKIVGSAPDPYIARDMILQHNPDVVLLDIEMPRMDGLTFLKKLMKYYPLPVIILSSITPRGAGLALDCFQAGAVDVISKPGSSFSVSGLIPLLVDKIRAAARANMQVYLQRGTHNHALRTNSDLTYRKISNKIIAIGASTGGTQAIESVLMQLPENTPGILIVQHMPEKFTASFACRLDEKCAVRVREARNRESVVPGTALIAPGNYHLLLRRSGARFFVEINQGPLICRQRPSADILFRSVAQKAGTNAAGVLLTGMGKDGARGLLLMRQAGAKTIAQDKDTSVVFGMPQEAINLGAAESVLPLQSVPKALMDWTASER